MDDYVLFHSTTPTILSKSHSYDFSSYLENQPSDFPVEVTRVFSGSSSFNVLHSECDKDEGSQLGYLLT